MRHWHKLQLIRERQCGSSKYWALKAAPINVTEGTSVPKVRRTLKCTFNLNSLNLAALNPTLFWAGWSGG